MLKCWAVFANSLDIGSEFLPQSLERETMQLSQVEHIHFLVESLRDNQAPAVVIKHIINIDRNDSWLSGWRRRGLMRGIVIALRHRVSWKIKDRKTV